MSGQIVKDPITGQIVDVISIPLADRYPTGRKLCTSRYHKGPRWCHLCDFGWKSNDDTYQSWCRACQRIHGRKGKEPRVILSSESGRMTQKNIRNRAWYAEWIKEVKADPERYQEYLETQRLKNYDRARARGIPQRHRKIKGAKIYVNPDLFMEWLHWNPRAAAMMTDSEARRIRDIRNGIARVINLSRVDTIMSRAGHHGQAEVLYPPGTEVNKLTGKPVFKKPRKEAA